MMRARTGLHCIVGLGNVGRLHGAILSAQGRPFIGVDPNPAADCFRSFDELPRPIRDQIGFWHICTPTGLHLSVVRRILEFNERARLLIEKPICQRDQLSAMRSVLACCPEARVLVNEQYRYSAALHWLRSTREKRSHAAPIHIEIEMSKNRQSDVANGRFVDNQAGVFGYEWPHLTTALSVLLTADEFDEFLGTPGVLGEAIAIETEWPPLTASETVRLSNHLEVRLYSSVGGHVLLRDEDAFKAYGLCGDDGSAAQIAWDDPLRYRVARIRTPCHEAKVIFEPRSVMSEDRRNFHLCKTSSGGRTAELFVESNHFASAIAGATNLLSDDQVQSASLRLARLQQHFAVQERLRTSVDAWRLPAVGERSFSLVNELGDAP